MSMRRAKDRPLNGTKFLLLGDAAPRDCALVGAFTDMPRANIHTFGPLSAAAIELAAAVAESGADAVVWSAPPKDRAFARAALAQAAEAGVRMFVAHGDQLRTLTLDDLIPSERSLNQALVAARLKGKRILVTGGAGSIGAELVRRLASIGPARLVALDISEYSVFQLQHDAALVGAPFSAVLCDIADADEVRQVFERERPDIVFHAAALKHVPLVEANACRGAKVNVLGTRNVAEACAQIGADLVFVSTDKAVHPKSVMGATKRLGGMYCRALDIASAEHVGPRRIVVRLGNVLGSAGSAAPLFERQLAEGGPLTVTHAKAERFFVTLAQAADSLMQAAAIGLAPSSPRGAAYVLEMGDPISILDLAHDVIRLAGKRPDVDVAIKFVGLRPGEKLTEELVAEDEFETATQSRSVRAVRAELPPLREIEAALDRVLARARAGDVGGVKRALEAATQMATQRLRAVS